jgi:putative DNA primase/helicase
VENIQETSEGKSERAAAVNGAGPHLPDDDRPEVVITHELHLTIDDTAAVLSRDPTIFERDHELVTVISAPEVARAKAPIAPGTPVIRPILPPTMVERLTKIATFHRRAKPSSKAIQLAEAGGPKPEAKWVRCQPPHPVVHALLARGRWPVPPLVGVTETPILRLDGTLHERPGYDPATGYYYAPSCALPPMPEHPTRDDAVAALAELEDALVDFPHVDRAHKLVPVAAVLTILAKTAIDGPVPLFVLDASTRGSGKTLQADVISLISLGRDAGRLTHPETDEELEKILSAYAIAGSRLILIDNILRTLGGGPIDKVLTTRTDVELRQLGASLIRRLPWTAVILASGNNVQLGDDTLRRTLVSRLESDMENPEARTGFVHDPLHSWVRAERPRLLRAALIVLRAYAAKGWPQTDVPRWGSFEAWTTVVAGAIRFAGGPSVLSCKPSAGERGDGTVAALGTILRELPRLAQGTEMKVKGILEALYPHEPDGAPRGPDGFDDFREALETIAPPRSGHTVDARLLGKRLSGHTGRLLAGRRLRKTDPSAGSVAWFVTDADGKRITS